MRVEEIKSRSNIVAVIGRYLELRRQGRRWWGLCPFHDDHNPSLTVDGDKQTFVCYACGERGDVIAFVQKIEKCSFTEALERLGGNSIPHSNAGPESRRDKKSTEKGYSRAIPHRLRDDSEGNTRNSRQVIPDHSQLLPLLMPYPAGDPHLTAAYLDFEVGMAPNVLPSNWRYLSGRLVFPIRDYAGRLTGFSGRAAGEDSTVNKSVKYMNTSQEHGFYRRRVLYGLHRADKAIRETRTLYLVEGFKDCIAMHAAGFTNCAALMGTAFTIEQIQIVFNYCCRVVLMMDGDPAGAAAAVTIGRMLKKSRIESQTITLPEGTDPDGIYRSMGRDRFRRFVSYRTDPPDLFELLLLTACSRWPEAEMELEGNTVSCVSVVQTVLKKEDIPLKAVINQELLDALAGNDNPDLLPAHLREWMDRLLSLYSSELEMHHVPDKPHSRLIIRLLMMHGCGYLSGQLDATFSIIRETHDRDVRLQALQRMQKIKKQQHDIARYLKHAGFISPK